MLKVFGDAGGEYLSIQQLQGCMRKVFQYIQRICSNYFSTYEYARRILPYSPTTKRHKIELMSANFGNLQDFISLLIFRQDGMSKKTISRNCSFKTPHAVRIFLSHLYSIILFSILLPFHFPSPLFIVYFSSPAFFLSSYVSFPSVSPPFLSPVLRVLSLLFPPPLTTPFLKYIFTFLFLISSLSFSLFSIFPVLNQCGYMPH
jgi:hypothetical protein